MKYLATKFDPSGEAKSEYRAPYLKWIKEYLAWELTTLENLEWISVTDLETGETLGVVSTQNQGFALAN